MKDEYQIVIQVTKASKGQWWAKLYERRIIKGLQLYEIGEISWNQVISNLVSEIEDIIKQEQENLQKKIKV